MDPVIRTIMLIISPMGDNALDMVNDVGDLNIRPIILLTPIVKKINSDSQAVGT